MKLTNQEIFKLCSSAPSFNNFTSKVTKEIFTENGFEELKEQDKDILADFFGLSVRVYLQKITNQRPHIPALYKKVVEEYANPFGGIAQRISMLMPKPTDPKYRKLVNGGSIDPFKIRIPKVEQRFYKQNFDFANYRTLQDIELRKIFLSEYGIADFVNKLRESFDDSYYIQKFLTLKELINGAIHTENFPLKDTQIIELPRIDENATNSDMSNFIQQINNIADVMDTTVMSGEFNAKGYEHGLYKNEYVLLIRANVFNKIKTTLMATTYHTQNLNFDFEVEKVNNFGGITYEDKNGTPLLPIYDDDGAVIGYNASGTGEPLPKTDIVEVDPNEHIQAMLVQKGAFFTSEQQAYSIKSIYNPAGEYLNIFANQPNASFNYDATYDIIEFIEPLNTITNNTNTDTNNTNTDTNNTNTDNTDNEPENP